MNKRKFVRSEHIWVKLRDNVLSKCDGHFINLTNKVSVNLKLKTVIKICLKLRNVIRIDPNLVNMIMICSKVRNLIDVCSNLANVINGCWIFKYIDIYSNFSIVTHTFSDPWNAKGVCSDLSNVVK